MSEFNCRIKAALGDPPYSGASLTRKQLSQWLPTRMPADADLLPNLGLLVARTRDLDRNNGVAAGAFQSLNDSIVGSGLRLASWPNYRALGRSIEWAQEFARQVESLWKTWADTCACDAAYKQTFAGLTQLVLRSGMSAGEALGLVMWQERKETPFKTCIQLVDSDRLGDPVQDLLTPTRNLRGGIEIDDFGRPLAYWIRKQPDMLGLSFFSVDAVRVPATTEWGRKRVLHVYQPTRVDQTRGTPILTPVIEQFKMLDAYQRTELQSAIVNALVAGVIETPMDPAGIAELMGGDPSAYLQNKNQYRVQLEGGSMIPLYPGDKLTPFAPARPSAQFPAFIETVMRLIGNALGMPYELVLKDFSKTNYSSARAALLEAWRFFYSRRNWLSTYWAQPVYELWLEEAVNAGLIDAPDYYSNREYYSRAKWIGPGRGWVDPVKEAQAAVVRIGNYISTLEIECAEQGLDWQEVLDQHAVERARMDQLGLPQPSPNAAMKPEPQPQQPPLDEPAPQDPAQQEAA